MAVVELTKSDFTEIVGRPGTVLVDFWASWVRPVPDVRTVLRAGRAPAGRHHVRQGEHRVVVSAQPGALPAVALDELITRVGELDMDQVRAAAQPRH